MANKKIYNYKDIKKEILEAVDLIADPIRQTLSPKGANVIYEDDRGNQFITNDGATIAKNIVVKNPIHNAIIQIIKDSALKTNLVAGDGTSTTTLLTSVLIKEGFRLLDNGYNPMLLKKENENFGKKLKTKLSKLVKKIKTQQDKEYIAKISANNDLEIAKDVVKIVDIAGLDGMIIPEIGHKKDTEIIADTGFIVENGMFTQELRTSELFAVSYRNIPVFITDKRLYYAQEAETILGTCLKNGYKEVVIIANDFIGEALPYFVSNHVKRNMNILLIKDPQAGKNDGINLKDLAVYLNGKVISDKSGSIVDKIKMEDFCMADKVYSDAKKSVIMRGDRANPKLSFLVDSIKREIKKIGENKDNQEIKELKRRLAALTNGMVTIKIGGATMLEIQEKAFRYEDAVNALRSAIKDGYLIGGGISIYNSFDPKEYKENIELLRMYKNYTEAGLRQIAENCGLSGDNVIEKIEESKTFCGENTGLNASNLEYEDLLKAGVIDPFKVTEMAIDNSISIANVILSSKYLIVNDIDDENTISEKKKIK